MRSNRSCLSIKSLSTCVRKPSKNSSKLLLSWIAFVLLCCPSSCHIVQDPYEDLSLQTWDFFLLSEEDIIYYFILIKQSTADTPKKMSPTNPNLLSASASQSKTSHTPAALSSKGQLPILAFLASVHPLQHSSADDSTPAVWDIPPHLSKPKEINAFKKKKEIKFLYMYNLNSHKHKFKERYSTIIMSFHRLLATDQTNVFQAYGCIMIETMIEQWNSAQVLSWDKGVVWEEQKDCFLRSFHMISVR